MNKTLLINSLFLFNNIDFEAIDRDFSIIDNVIEISYEPGEIILSTDENPIGIAIVARGKALISTSVHGKAPTLRSLSVGDTFGAASLFMRNRDYSTGVISDGESTVIYIDTETVRRLCGKIPEISMNYIEFLSDRIAFLNKKVSTFSAQSADARIAYYIDELVGGKEGTASIPVSYSQLADMLGLGRASLYRSLDNLCEQKIIAKQLRNITILDPEKLKKIYN